MILNIKSSHGKIKIDNSEHKIPPWILILLDIKSPHGKNPDTNGHKIYTWKQLDTTGHKITT